MSRGYGNLQYSLALNSKRFGLGPRCIMEDDATDPNMVSSWKRLFLSKAKLKAASQASALLAGFAMVALVELDVKKDGMPEGLLISFAICTVLLVSVNMLALMISTCILPNIEAIANLNILSFVKESPHLELQKYVELAWISSTILGVVLFMTEVGLLCWVQFINVSLSAALATTLVLVPVTLIFIFVSVKFYLALMRHNYSLRESDVQELEMLKRQWANTSLMKNGGRKSSLQTV